MDGRNQTRCVFSLLRKTKEHCLYILLRRHMNVNLHLIMYTPWLNRFHNEKTHMMIIVPVDVVIKVYASFVVDKYVTPKCLTKLHMGFMSSG